MTRSEFENIAAQLRQKVLKVSLNFFGSKEDAEDAAQETTLRTQKNRPSVRLPKRSWRQRTRNGC